MKYKSNNLAYLLQSEYSNDEKPKVAKDQRTKEGRFRRLNEIRNNMILLSLFNLVKNSQNYIIILYYC